ncbi:MAG: glycosyltransferase family 39 protein, partial [Bryobacteraceae bacterium]
VHDWAARIPVALSAVLLCWLTARFGAWAFGSLAGLYSGLALATSMGLWLFTRIQIPDVTVTLTIALSMWAFLRALDDDEPHPRIWAAVCAAAIGTGLLLKGLIAAVFPVAGALLFLLVERRLFDRTTWRRLHPFTGLLIALAIAAPWHILAAIRNPPIWEFTMVSAPGNWHGFFWFYFMNEHVLRFLNLRFPRDYNTVPRALFWLLHLAWLFPFSVFLPAAFTQSFRGTGRAARVRMLAICWTGFLLTFFTFSSTQEYYSMPCYPALALLLGSAIASQHPWLRGGRMSLGVVTGLAALACFGLLSQVWNLPAPGDISRALDHHPDVYTLSLGHMGDLTIASFAYLRPPLALAGLAFLIGAITSWRPRLAIAGMTVMMVMFLHAARFALTDFDPYLASRPLAESLKHQPPGDLIVDDQYYTFSSVFFYADLANGPADPAPRRRAWLLNGRVNNLEYGSNAPGAPAVFLSDPDFVKRWASGDRYYLMCEKPQVERFEKLIGKDQLSVVAESGGKFLFSNQR